MASRDVGIRRSLGRLSRIATVVACFAIVPAQTSVAQAPEATPDTAAARRVVDSLVRVGAWPRSVTNAIRPVADTILTQPSAFDETLHIAALFGGLVVLVGLSILTVWCAVAFMGALKIRMPITMRSHWGGFGGGGSGWEISPGLTLLALTATFAILTTIVANSLLASARPGGSERKPDIETPTSGSASAKIEVPAVDTTKK
jgi:hypothetical protein